MALGQKHEVKVALESYTHLVIGTKKIGKSSLIADIAKEIYGGINNLLVISIGDEDGYSALDGLIYENPMSWKEFVAIVDELVKNADENPFKIVSIDTIDELVTFAEKETIRLSNIENPTKQVQTVNAAFGGYGHGRDKVIDIIQEQIMRLRRTKYGVFLVGHNKIKSIKQKLEGDNYNVISSNLTEDFFNAFAYKADIICNIVSEKVVKNGALDATERYMYFRDDGFVEAGSRFPTMPTHVPYGARTYYDAVISGIKASLNTTVSDKEFEKKRQTALKQKESDAKKYAEKDGQTGNEEILEMAVSAFKSGTKDQKEQAKQMLQKFGIANFKDPDAFTRDQLTEMLNIFKEEDIVD
jgi:hypothetical protein